MRAPLTKTSSRTCSAAKSSSSKRSRSSRSRSRTMMNWASASSILSSRATSSSCSTFQQRFPRTRVHPGSTFSTYSIRSTLTICVRLCHMQTVSAWRPTQIRTRRRPSASLSSGRRNSRLCPTYRVSVILDISKIIHYLSLLFKYRTLRQDNPSAQVRLEENSYRPKEEKARAYGDDQLVYRVKKETTIAVVKATTSRVYCPGSETDCGVETTSLLAGATIPATDVCQAAAVARPQKRRRNEEEVILYRLN